MKLKATYNKDSIHEDWESVYRNNKIQDRFNDKIMDRIIKVMNVPDGALFLDAGCGIGDHSIRIAKRGYRCVGADISSHILEQGRKNILNCQLESRISLVCQALEDLPFPDSTFDAIHCRGVLMHIPQWEKALNHLCRVLKPGGKIVILESNHTSLETFLVLMLRRFRRTDSEIVEAKGGAEFWSEKEGNPFLVRVANLKYLIGQLREYGVTTVNRFSTEFWDIYRFPEGIIRDLVVRYNRLWFSLHLTPYLSVGNAIVGEKLRK